MMGLAKVKLKVGRRYVAESNSGRESECRLLYRDYRTGHFAASNGLDYYTDGRARGATGTISTLVRVVSERVWPAP